MSVEERPQDPQHDAAERCTLPGHDRDVALAVLGQSRGRGGIDDIQVAHLLAMGFNAGMTAARCGGRRTSWLGAAQRKLRRILE